ncbi:MAG TPA: thioesterase family protein [Vicinamibacteria bacterium]|nr:thioesterase family protein [Vicinamibacteria bacterium]
MLLLEGRVERDWVDYNGHLNVAYYHMAFDRATDVFLQRIGLGPEYVESHAGSMFALEDHLVYLRELREGEPFRIMLQLLDWDSKRLHYFQRLFHREKDFLSATCEHLSIFVDMKTRRSAQLPASTRSILEDLFEEHRRLEKPEQAGRVMGIRRA